MPRLLRITIPNLPFHILNRGNNRQSIFLCEEDFAYFIELLKRFKKELKFKLYHFCLMPNHTHFVMEPTIEGSLPKIMLKLTLAHTRYFNKKYNGVGHVWQGRYKSSLVDTDDYFIWCGIYNELNPIRAGLVKNPEDWKWSSFRFYGLGDNNFLTEELMDMDPFYIETGETTEERCKRYQKNIKNIINEDFLRNIRKSLDQGVFGRQSFVQEMKEKFKIASLMPRGRPRKNQKNQS